MSNINKQNIPVYSLSAFSAANSETQQFQIEVFDANRHFQVEYPHRHDFYEVLFLTNGSGFHVIDDNSYEVHPPCIFFLSPGQAHKLELSHDIEGYLFIFTADFYLLPFTNANRLLDFPFFFSVTQSNPPLQIKNKTDVDFFRSLFVKGVEEMVKPEGYSTPFVRSLLDTILVYSNRLYPMEAREADKGRSYVLAKRFLQLVEERYRENLSVNDYAELLAITPNHLSQTLKQFTGKTAANIIHAKQIIEIKRLLVHTSLSVAEIAEQLGFVDQSYFTRFFKKATGTTPLLFRAKSI